MEAMKTLTMTSNDWIYDGETYLAEDIDDYYGFVYLITDLTNDKKYIGKKFFWSTKKLPPLKGRKNKRIQKKESDWRMYYGSSDEVKNLVEEFGPSRFKREILKKCKSRGELSYVEAKLQFDNNVLFRDDYYNEFIGVKIHSKHVKGLKEDYVSSGDEDS